MAKDWRLSEPPPHADRSRVAHRFALPSRRRGVRRRPRAVVARARGGRGRAGAVHSVGGRGRRGGARGHGPCGVAGGTVRRRRFIRIGPVRMPGASMRRWPSSRRAIERRGAVVVGEIGLDYHYDFAPRDVQREVFAAQVALAGRAGAGGGDPHARGDGGHPRRSCARPARPSRGVMHCFSGSVDEARAALDLGLLSLDVRAS